MKYVMLYLIWFVKIIKNGIDNILTNIKIKVIMYSNIYEKKKMKSLSCSILFESCSIVYNLVSNYLFIYLLIILMIKILTIYKWKSYILLFHM